MKSLSRIAVLFLAVLLSACNAPSRQTATGQVQAEIPPEDARLLWYDATANFERLGTPEGVDRMLARTDSVGFTDIIIDVKPISGETLYDSEYAPRMRTWDGYTRDDDFDFVQYTTDRARERGLRVHLALNVFAEGHKYVSRGPIYDEHPEWQTMWLMEGGEIMPTTEVEQGYSAFTNPLREDVRQHQLNIIREMAERFRPDGIVLDRARYDNLYSDFSEESREAFEEYLEREVENWPSDIMTRTSDPASPERGPLFREWLVWRTSVITSFFEEARDVVKSVDPAMLFEVYVGAWYPIYYEMGVNWASRDYDPSEDYDWALPEYREHAYAELLDVIMTGNYFVEVTPEELAETNEAIRLDTGVQQQRDSTYNVESSIRLVDRLIGDAARVYPSLYVEQYAMEGKPENFARALDKTLEMKGGVMIFDLVHLERDGLWDVVARAFNAN
ncbi:MAG: alpha amylase family protein [Bacteroidota bacterium]